VLKYLPLLTFFDVTDCLFKNLFRKALPRYFVSKLCLHGFRSKKYYPNTAASYSNVVRLATICAPVRHEAVFFATISALAKSPKPPSRSQGHLYLCNICISYSPSAPTLASPPESLSISIHANKSLLLLLILRSFGGSHIPIHLLFYLCIFFEILDLSIFRRRLFHQNSMSN
jgi:hypothetical protein